MLLLKYLMENDSLVEGLISSVSSDKFQRMMGNWLKSNDYVILTAVKDGKKRLGFNRSVTKQELELLLKFINNLGWFVSAYKEDMFSMWKKFNKDFQFKSNQVSIIFQIEPKFSQKLTDIKIGYHVTPSIYDSKIKSVGLVPKNKSKISYHPERIYFSKTVSGTNKLLTAFKKSNLPIKKYSVYAIDVENILKDIPDFTLFEDPNFDDGVFTLSNIHPKYITFAQYVEV